MFIISDIHGEVSQFDKFFKSDEKFCLQLGDFGLIFSEKENLNEEKNLINQRKDLFLRIVIFLQFLETMIAGRATLK